jgi:hypothetical protein
VEKKRQKWEGKDSLNSSRKKVRASFFYEFGEKYLHLQALVLIRIRASSISWMQAA